MWQIERLFSLAGNFAGSGNSDCSNVVLTSTLAITFSITHEHCTHTFLHSPISLEGHKSDLETTAVGPVTFSL